MGLSLGTLFPLSWRLWLGKLLFRPFDGPCTRVSWHRVIKGPCRPSEVEAMQYIALHTNIPIPKVYAVHTWEDRIYIEMAYIKGDNLDDAWRTKGALTPEQKKVIFADINQYVCILRGLKPPSEDLVASAFQNPAYDCRIGFRFFGPMNHREFQSLTRQHLRFEDIGLLGKEVEQINTTRYRTYFTHGDLIPRNIIIRNGRVAALIDWGFSGWYPEYWEFTKAHYDYFPSEEWYEYLRQALPCYDVELAAERTLWTRLPEPGTHTVGYYDGQYYENTGSKPSPAWVDARAGRQLTDLWSLVEF